MNGKEKETGIEKRTTNLEKGNVTGEEMKESQNAQEEVVENLNTLNLDHLRYAIHPYLYTIMYSITMVLPLK